MKRFIPTFLSILILLYGCTDRVVSSRLSVYNMTASQIRIVSNIVSDLYNTEQEFELGSGEMKTIAHGYNLSEKYYIYRPPYNHDASVSLYMKTSAGYVLVKEWKFEEYDDKAKSIFNPLFYSMDIVKDTKTHLERNFVFTILPEDLEIPAEAHEVCSSL